MKRRLLTFCAVVLLLLLIALVLAEERVWIAASGNGKKYHYENCRTLWGGKKRIPISEAKAAGYTGCEVCKR